MEVEKTQISFIFSYAQKPHDEWIEEVHNAEELNKILEYFLQEVTKREIFYEKENGNFLIYFLK